MLHEGVGFGGEYGSVPDGRAGYPSTGLNKRNTYGDLSPIWVSISSLRMNSEQRGSWIHCSSGSYITRYCSCSSERNLIFTPLSQSQSSPIQSSSTPLLQNHLSLRHEAHCHCPCSGCRRHRAGRCCSGAGYAHLVRPPWPGLR